MGNRFGRQLAWIVACMCLAMAGESLGADYFRATKQHAAPAVAWVRSVAPGLGGNLIAEPKGGVYLWYKTKARVLKYDQDGKLLWDKRFVPKGRASWTSVFENSKGELYVSRQIGEKAILARLLPSGVLSHEIQCPRNQALASGCSAITGSGGWVTIETRASQADKLQNPESVKKIVREYVAKYSPSGKLEWSEYLQDLDSGVNNADSSCTSATLDMALDSHGNSYILKGDATLNGIVNAKLTKFSIDKTTAWNVDIPLNADAEMSIRPDSSDSIYVIGQKNDVGYQIAKFDTNGKQIWVRQPESAISDMVEKVTLDKQGCIYIAGRVSHSLNSATFVAKHDPSGQLLWRKTLTKITRITGLAVQNGAVYVSGVVQGKGQMYLIRLGK